MLDYWNGTEEMRCEELRCVRMREVKVGEKREEVHVRES